MKKQFLLTAAALLLLSCNSKSMSSNGDEKSRELKTQVFEFESNDNQAEVKLTIEMPVGGDKELGDNIFDYILEQLTNDYDCSDDLTAYRNDGQGLVDLFGKMRRDDLREQWSSFTEDTDQNVTFGSTASFSLLEDNDKYITYLYESDCFNGADGIWSKTGVTFLKSDCSRVTNDFLFNDPTSPQLVTVLRDDLIKRYCQGEDASYDEPDVETIEAVLDEPFYITSEGLAYFYRRGLVFFQNAVGVLAWDKVKELLTDKAKELLD